jgi:hypothetical protein
MALHFDGLPDLELHDLATQDHSGESSYRLLRGLEDLHLEYFPHYPHVVDELEDWFQHGWPDNEVVVHVVYGTLGDQPAFECLLHTNTARGITLVHHLAASRELRSITPRGWLAEVVAMWFDFGTTDCAAANTDLLAVMAEVPPNHLHKWLRLGFGQVGLDYGEPLGGRRRHREFDPVYASIEPIVMLTSAGVARGYSHAVTAAFSAMLLDYYQLPPEAEQVVGILTQAQRITGPLATEESQLHAALPPGTARS